MVAWRWLGSCACKCCAHSDCGGGGSRPRRLSNWKTLPNRSWKCDWPQCCAWETSHSWTPGASCPQSFQDYNMVNMGCGAYVLISLNQGCNSFVHLHVMSTKYPCILGNLKAKSSHQSFNCYKLPDSGNSYVCSCIYLVLLHVDGICMATASWP